MIECPKCQMQCPDEALFCGNCAAPLSRTEGNDPFVGLCIDNKYTIVKRIAAGGMGVVYLAKQRCAGQFVAIKKLHAEYYRDKNIVARFMDEARSYGKIAHPNAVKLHDLLNVNGQICIVMEFVAGKTLTHYIESGYVFSLRQIADISLQIADALGTVHRAGIIHRDLKTENIMLLETVPGRFSVKILDFGIAKMLDKPVDRKTKDGIIVGTPEFMSPEQCYGANVDNRTDIYSFGILMYVMICNRLPYESDSPMMLLQMQINAPLPDVVRINGEHVPHALSAIVRKCMMKSSKDRYDSFTEVIADLTQFQENGMGSVVATPPENHAATRSPNPVESTTAEAKKNHNKDFAFVLDDEHDDKSVSFSHEDKLAADSHEDDENDNSGLGLEIDLDDDHDDPTPPPNDDETTNASDDSDSDCYSLGDISKIEGSGNDDASPAPRHVAQTIAIVAIVLIAVAAAAFALLGKSSDDAVDRKGEIADADNNAPVQNDQPDNAQEENPIKEALQTAAKPAEPDPIQPSRAAERNALMRGIARACMEASIRDMNAGNLDAAQTSADFAHAQNDTLTDRDAKQLSQLRDQLAAFQNIWQSAQNAGQKCDKIGALLAQLPESASGMKEKLNDIERKCQRKLEAPPTTL